MSNESRLESMALALPGAERVEIEAWDGEPTFRVNGKNFIFADREFTGISVKLTKDEAEAVIATDPDVTPTGYGLGRHGWISVALPPRPTRQRWEIIEEWVRTSYTLVAPKKLAKQILEEER